MDCCSAIRQSESERRRRPESLERRAASRVFESEVAMAVHDLQSEFCLRRFDRAAQGFGPSDGADGSSGCGLQKSSIRRSVQHADQETCVQVDHRDSLESRRKDALRISFAWCSQPARSTPRAATDFWSARRACIASAGDGCRSASLRIALRSASDFETFQRRANPSSVRTVPTSREYVDLIVMTAMPFTVWPYQAVRRIVAILPPRSACGQLASSRRLSAPPYDVYPGAVPCPRWAGTRPFAMMPPDPARVGRDVPRRAKHPPRGRVVRSSA